MIIVLSPADQTIIDSARRQSTNDHRIYGDIYVMGEYIPRLPGGENLFFTGHGSPPSGGDLAQIGYEDADHLGLDGLELFENFQEIIPADRSVDVYIDACYAANVRFGSFSLIETFRSGFDVTRNGAVYGRIGAVGTLIPKPNDPSWIRA
ncbi:MAG: hypothetical protein HKP61_10210 [Dactylosporangium sp.]|nr:hypothetical protein [Dactylosporangium sp.]NNJ61304.1 hypothetical protein [Dactylosporangium sp.]